MFSNDKNVELIARLIRNLRRYGELRLESLRLDVITKVTVLLSTLLIGLVFFCLIALVVLLLSFGAVVWLGPHVGGYASACGIVAGGFLLILWIVVAFRKTLVVRPIMRFMVTLFLKEDSNEDQIANSSEQNDFVSHKYKQNNAY